MKHKLLTSLSLALVLGGCMGYSPLYAPVESSMEDLYVGKVAMDDIAPDVGERRVAQMVGQMLRQHLRGTSAADYRLDIQIDEEHTSLAVRRDATDQRLQIELTAQTRLLKGADLVLETEIESQAAYNVEDSPFGTESGKEQAREEAARELADKVMRRVALFLHQQQAAQ